MSVPTNLIPSFITQLPEYTGTDTAGYFPYAFNGRTYKVAFAQLAQAGAVPASREINTGNGLTGGGNLTQNRTISIANGGVGAAQLDQTGVVAGTYGDFDKVAQFTVDANGRISSVSDVPIVLSGYVPITRSILAGTGLSGGGTLNADRTLSINFSSAAPEPLGVPTAGVGTQAARDDHVHPAVDLSDTTETQGTLPLARGGTGNSLSPVAGAIVYSDGTNFELTNPGNAGEVLTSNGSGQPYWTAVTGTGTVTSVDLTAGTGISVSGGPITTFGSITVTNTAPDQVVSLTGAGTTSVTGTYPNFTITSADQYVGTVTSVDVSGGTTGLTFINGPITTAGTITMGGTLGVANGGTGLTAAPTNGQLLIGNGTNYTLAVLTAGSNIGITNGAGSISIAVTGTVPSATNLAGGTANQIAYQTGAGATSFITAPTVANTYLEWSGSAFQWSANPLGTVTSVAALTLTSNAGSDLSSTVANPTTTPVITLNVPNASATQRGALTSTDWSTFNGKQDFLVSGTNIKTVSGQSLLGSGDVGTIGVAYGGTGLTTTPSNGQLLIGNGTGYTLATLTDGTGISITEGAGTITVTNSAPDQVVSLTGAGTTVVTGTYPNFTITSNDQFTGTVTSVGGTGTVNGITLTGTVTTSGSLTLGGTLSGVDLTTQITGILPIANGGTNGTATPTAGAVAYGTGTAYAFTSAGTAGQVLISNGTSAPSFGGIDGGTF